MPEVIQFEKPKEHPAESGGFVRTATADDILRSIALIRSIDGPAITLISGASGIGKTETLLHYQRENWETTHYISVAHGEGNPFHVASQILAGFVTFGARGKGLDELRLQAARCIGPRGILFVDDAQNLFQRHKLSATKGSSFGWLIAAAMQGGFDLAFCGDLSLQSIIAEHFEHIDSRIRRKTILKGVAAADVDAIAASEGVFGRGEMDLLTAVSKLRGGLRNVENVLRMAAIFAGRDKVTVHPLKVAIQDLKLHNAGGM
jgi:hypothetical protein